MAAGRGGPWTRLLAHLASRGGWRAPLTAFAFGALAAAALPPLHLVPVLFVSFPALMVLVGSRRTLSGAFVTGWAWGVGHFVAGLYWISNALLTEAERFAWLVPLAVPALSSVLALFIAFPAVLACRFFSEGWARVLALAGLWTLGELARGVALTGFPWNLLGTVWAFGAFAVQGAAWIGTHGLSALTVVLACLPILPRRSALAAGAVMVGGGVLVGLVRLWPEEPPAGPVAIRIVQGNIAQAHKWRDDLRAAHFRRYLQLTAAVPEAGEGEGPLVVVWPETASPYFLDTDETARAFAGAALREGAVLIAGTVRLERSDGGPGPPLRLWNSLVAIAPDGSLLAVYDKHHLVPFGEYVPLRSILPMETVVPGNIDFSAGAGPSTLRLPEAFRVPPASPLICYEVIFPGRVTEAGVRPGWLLNLTNDAWFGVSSGPYQHLAAARMRAVEEGLPLVRAANTGVSAVFDSRGRTVARLGLNETGVIAAPLPSPGEHTPFARFGLVLPLSVAVACLAGAAGARPGRSGL
ncbi:MAG: apolipoprotein N-acyltransferase [Acetobacteraceae bacterium]|nr:apolipoprotein N-acyltransferase [Acetobacteraceae bacterium]